MTGYWQPVIGEAQVPSSQHSPWLPSQAFGSLWLQPHPIHGRDGSAQ
jgi:hypothetical protein